MKLSVFDYFFDDANYARDLVIKDIIHTISSNSIFLFITTVNMIREYLFP